MDHKNFDNNYATFKVVENESGNTLSLYILDDDDKWLPQKRDIPSSDISKLFLGICENGIRHALNSGIKKKNKIVSWKNFFISVDYNYHAVIS